MTDCSVASEQCVPIIGRQGGPAATGADSTWQDGAMTLTLYLVLAPEPIFILQQL